MHNLLIGLRVSVQVAAMTSINLVSPPPRKYAALGKGCVAFETDPERAARAFACGALLSSMLAVGCVSGLQAAEPRTSAAKTPTRTQVASGSPRSYEVLGKRYNVRASSEGYRESGTASWYGHPFDGRPTSSGEMYDMMEMTAAHQTLPIPTWVEVTNLKNGKKVTVKVNDRGPFVAKRLIDLSYGAATALDMVKDGTARVEVRALPGPPAEKAPAPRDNRNQSSTQARERRDVPERALAPSPVSQAKAPAAPVKPRPDSPTAARTVERQSPPLDPERLFAEAGRFTNRDEAVELVSSLRAEGFMNAFVVTEDRKRKLLHRVRVGPLSDAAAVDSMNERLRGFGARRSHRVAMN
jgi:rare lipoprotein A